MEPLERVPKGRETRDGPARPSAAGRSGPSWSPGRSLPLLLGRPGRLATPTRTQTQAEACVRVLIVRARPMNTASETIGPASLSLAEKQLVVLCTSPRAAGRARAYHRPPGSRVVPPAVASLLLPLRPQQPLHATAASPPGPSRRFAAAAALRAASRRFDKRPLRDRFCPCRLCLASPLALSPCFMHQ